MICPVFDVLALGYHQRGAICPREPTPRPGFPWMLLLDDCACPGPRAAQRPLLFKRLRKSAQYRKSFSHRHLETALFRQGIEHRSHSAGGGASSAGTAWVPRFVNFARIAAAVFFLSSFPERMSSTMAIRSFVRVFARSMRGSE
jgi:hypothetical protein